MLAKLAALACAAACALAQAVPAAEIIDVALERRAGAIEVAVTDDTLDSDGLAVSASVDLELEVVNGMAVVNGEYALPVGLTQIQMKADVKKYVLAMGSSKRKCHKTIHDVDVGVAARVMRNINDPGTMHITLQLTEYDGATREIEHTTKVSVTVDEKEDELVRTIDPKSAPLSVKEKLEAAKHKVTSFMDSEVDAVQEDAHTAWDWFMDKWNAADDYGKASIVAVLSFSLALVMIGLTCCCRACCSRKAASKGANYKKNLGGVRVQAMVGDKFKGVKYTALHA